MIKNRIAVALTLQLLCLFTFGQSAPQRNILVDVAHKQVFWHDPARMEGLNKDWVERIQYMSGEIEKTAASVNAKVRYQHTEITAKDLASCNLLFIHTPKSKYSTGEINAITAYVKNGGAMFMVMDADYWSSLQDVNANDLVMPFGFQFKGESKDTLSGAVTMKGPITPKPLKITYHEARIIEGGKPFASSLQTHESFGKYLQLDKGGKLIVMGEGMVSLYMTEWEGVKDYQCQEFMHDVFAWLLKK